MTKKRIGIFILCALSVLPLLCSPAKADGKKDGGWYSIGFFGINDQAGTLPRIELYDYLAPGKATLGLHYWTDQHPGRHDELTITNPGDQDHEISLKSNTEAWRMELSEKRIFHSLTPDWRTTRTWDAFSLKSVRPGHTRASLTINSGKRSGNLSALQPVGQAERNGQLLLQTPAGSVSASLAVIRAGMTNGADNRVEDGYSGVYAYKPGLPLSAVVSMNTAELNNSLDVSGVPTVRNDSFAFDVSLRMNRGYALTANARFDEMDSSTSNTLSTDDTALGVGIHGGGAGNTWKLEYRYSDRSMSGIQTTGQKTNRLEAAFRLRPSWLRNSRIRAGARFENRDVSSTLQPSLKSFPELGSESSEAWLNASVPLFRKGGSATMFVRNKVRDFTLAPGVNRGTKSSDSLNYGVTTQYPMGKTTLSYTYYYGLNETTFLMPQLTASGLSVIEIEPANDQNTHTIGLNWAFNAKTDVDITAMFGKGRAGGLFEAGRTTEKDGSVSIRRRINSECAGNLTLRANDYRDNLASTLTEKNLMIETSITKSF